MNTFDSKNLIELKFIRYQLKDLLW